MVPTRVRLGVLGFACSLSLITYLDRVCIARVKMDIQGALDLSEQAMGLVFSAFSLGYCLLEVPGGWMGDVWGSRRVLTRIVLWWSAFTALSGCVWRFTWDSGYHLPLGSVTVPLVLNGLAALILVRFLFGAGEAGAYPNLTRVVGVWFPYRERALAQGAIWMSARLGGAVAPLVIGRLAVSLGWRRAFWILGLLGLAWVALFYRWFRDRPEDKASCNQAERDLIRAGKPATNSGAAHDWPPWGRLISSPTMWAMSLAAFFVSFGWYFYPTWQPQFFYDVYGDRYEDSEVVTGLPFLCGAVGSLLGGRLSDRLVRRLGQRWGRSLVGLVGFTGAGLCVLATGFAAHRWQAVTLLCLAFFINDLAIPALWAVSADVGGRYVGTVAGIMNMVGALGALLSPALTPVILHALPQTYSAALRWQVIFAGLAGAWFLGAVTWLFINAARPLFPPE